jgi:MFS family permease
MAHLDLPPEGTGDLAGAGTVFKNRAFVYLWSAQALSQLASNMVLAALMATVRRTTGSDTAVAILILTFLVPAVLFSTLGGVLVERSNAKMIMLATNVIRAVGIVGFIFVAPTTSDANVPLVYAINFGIATATAIFAPAELTAIPRIVDRRNLMAANSIFVLTINATFAIGFGVLGPLVLNVFGPIPVYVVVAVMFAGAAIAILPLPDVRPDHVIASAGNAAGRAAGELYGQLREGVDFVRQHRVIAWSLAYLGIASSLIGVLGAIGPGFAVDVLGLTPENFFFIMGPAGLGAVLGILFLNSYGKPIPKRLVIDIGLVSMGITLILLAIVKPVANSFGAATAPLEEAIPAIAPLVSVIAVVAMIALFPAGGSAVRRARADLRDPQHAALRRLVPAGPARARDRRRPQHLLRGRGHSGRHGGPWIADPVGRDHLVATQRPPGAARARSRHAPRAAARTGVRAGRAGRGRPGDAERGAAPSSAATPPRRPWRLGSSPPRSSPSPSSSRG